MALKLITEFLDFNTVKLSNLMHIRNSFDSKEIEFLIIFQIFIILFTQINDYIQWISMQRKLLTRELNHENLEKKIEN